MADEGSESSGSNPDYLQRLALESQIKFTYFLVGLSFAIVGLSIQITDQPSLVTYFSWLLLILSGLSGIFRLTWNPVAIRANFERLRAEDLKTELERAALQGTTIMVDQSTGEKTPIQSFIQGRESFIGTMKKKYKDISRKQSWRYNIQIWSFVIGILGLACDKIFFG